MTSLPEIIAPYVKQYLNEHLLPSTIESLVEQLIVKQEIDPEFTSNFHNENGKTVFKKLAGQLKKLLPNVRRWSRQLENTANAESASQEEITSNVTENTEQPSCGTAGKRPIGTSDKNLDHSSQKRKKLLEETENSATSRVAEASDEDVLTINIRPAHAHAIRAIEQNAGSDDIRSADGSPDNNLEPIADLEMFEDVRGPLAELSSENRHSTKGKVLQQEAFHDADKNFHFAMSEQKFATKDIVSVKVKGHSPRPAEIQSFLDGPSEMPKCKIRFFPVSRDRKNKSKFLQLKKPLFTQVLSEAEEKSVDGENTIGDYDIPNNKVYQALRIESRLLSLDFKIKKSLALSNPTPNVAECLSALKELPDLALTPLMLKKHPQIIQTLISLKEYVGNVTEKKAKAQFAVESARIRSESDYVFNQFKQLFPVPKGTSFIEWFTSELEKFKRETKGLSLEELYFMTE